MMVFKSSFDELDALTMGVVFVATLVSAATDLRSFKVYNVVTLPLFLLGVLYNIALCGWAGLTGSLIGAACGFGLMFVGYVLGKVGAGDVKLMAGIGAWLGAFLTFRVFLVATIVGGVVALVITVRRGLLRQTAWRPVCAILSLCTRTRDVDREETVQGIIAKGAAQGRAIPFAFAVFVGSVAVVFLDCLNGIV